MRRLTFGTERGGRGALRTLALLTFIITLLVVPATAGAAVAGGLKQKGCLSGDGTAGCGAARGLQNAGKMAITKDGKNVYVTSRDKNAIVAFTRDSAGKLVQASGITGCYTSSASTVTSDGCSLSSGDTNALTGANAIAVAPDGKSVYVATTLGNISTFKRATDGTLAFDNVITYLHSSSGSTAFSALAVSPDNKTVYLGGPGGYGGILWELSRDTSGGASHGTLGNTLFDCIAVSVCGSNNVPNLGFPADVLVTEDGKQVIVAGGEEFNTHNVVALNRNTTTGGLTPNISADHCVSGNSLANCTFRSSFYYPRALATSGNRDIYVGGYYTVSLIRRNPTANTIAPVIQADSCASYQGSGISDCTETVNCNAMCLGRALVLNADEKTLYSGTDNIGAMVAFNRNTSSGAFSRNTSPLGCLSNGTVPGCSAFSQGVKVEGLVGDPTGRFLYAAGGNRVLNFAIDRPPVCANVSAGTTTGSPIDISLNCSDPDGDALTYQKVTGTSNGSLADSFQGNRITYNPFRAGVDSFQYRAVAAGVASDPATASINVSNPPAPPIGGGGGGGGGGGTPPPGLIPSTVSNNWLAFPAFTKVTQLSVNNLPAGATVRVTCKTKKKSKQKKGCAYKSKRFTASGARAKLNLLKPFRKKKLPVGTKITISVTVPGQIGKRFQYTMRKRAIPKKQLRCISPAGNLSSCA